MHLAAERGHTGTVEFLADKFKASVFDRTKVGILHTTRTKKLADLNTWDHWKDDKIPWIKSEAY